MSGVEGPGTGHGQELRERAWRLGLQHRAPQWGWGRVGAALMPQRRAVVLTVIALLAMLPGLGIAAAMVRFGPGEPGNPTVLSHAFVVFGPVSAAPAALLLAVAGLLAGRPAARAVLFGTAALLLTLGGIGCGVGFSVGDEPIEGGARTAAKVAALGYGPFVLLMGLPALAFAAVAPFKIWAEFVDEQRRRLLDVTMARGSVAMGDLALATNAAPERMLRLLQGLVKEGKLAVHMDTRHQRVFTARRYASRQALLVELVEARGRVSMDWLAAELGEPRGVVESWAGELMDAGHLNARLENGSLQFDPGQGAATTRSCDSCGGPMKAVGRGVFYCSYCGTEIFT